MLADVPTFRKDILQRKIYFLTPNIVGFAKATIAQPSETPYSNGTSTLLQIVGDLSVY